MTKKTQMFSVIALFAIVFAISIVSAGDLVDIGDIKVDGLSLSHTPAGIDVSQTVPIEVFFLAKKDASDVRVKIYIEGYRDEVSDSTPRFKIIEGSSYVKRFLVELSSSLDLDDLDEDLELLVRFSAKGEESEEFYYDIKIQKELYRLDILSIEAPERVTAGDTIALDVVLTNNGHERLDNVYVKASIPELGITRNVYAGDLKPVEEEDYDQIRNSVEKRVYLAIPKNTLAGNYNIEVETYNYDTAVMAQKRIIVEAVQTGVLPSVTAKTIKSNEEAAFEVVLVNPNSRMIVYSITPESQSGLIVEVAEPIVSVPADSSRTVKVYVRPTDSVNEGTHVVTVNVNSEAGETKQVSFSLNVEDVETTGPTISGTNNTVLILTVVLSIIFVILLVILIVLLTRKPQETEEFGETSYY
jgi:uncharacterized repeat protein (TIGR01451 family)